MLPVRTVYNKSWIPFECKVDYFLSSDKTAFDGPVTTVHGIFFNLKKEILLVRHVKRGWEVPGGHIEEGESFLEAMHRELYEESQMSCESLTQLGFLRKEALEEKPINCTYPHPVSYCLFYAGVISEVDVFLGDEKIKEARFFDLSEASQNAWIINYIDYFEAAQNIYFAEPF